MRRRCWKKQRTASEKQSPLTLIHHWRIKTTYWHLLIRNWLTINGLFNNLLFIHSSIIIDECIGHSWSPLHLPVLPFGFKATLKERLQSASVIQLYGSLFPPLKKKKKSLSIYRSRFLVGQTYISKGFDGRSIRCTAVEFGSGWTTIGGHRDPSMSWWTCEWACHCAQRKSIRWRGSQGSN